MKQPPVKELKRSKDPVPAERKDPLARRRSAGEAGADVGTPSLRKGPLGFQTWRGPKKMIIIIPVDGFVKSPAAALRFNFVVAAHL